MHPVPPPEKPKPESFFKLSRDPEPSAGAKNYLSESHVRRLSHLLASVKPPFSVGLEGEWGKGKTFFISAVMAQPEMAARYEVITFDAWAAPSDGSLLPVLLNKIGVELKIESSDWFEKVIQGGEAISSFAALPAMANPIMAAKVGIFRLCFEVLTKLRTTLTVAQREALIRDLPKQFDSHVSAALKAKDKDALLIFIDNLDRCLPSAALDLIERTRQLFKSPQCVLIIAYDVTIIDDAIKARYGATSVISGRAYLEKLVDLPLQVPPAEPRNFIAMISAHYARYTEREGAEQAMTTALSSLSMMGELFRAEFLANPRKWFRIVRQLALYMHLSGTEQLHEHLPSILLLLATREHHPALYELIRSTPQVVPHLGARALGRQWKTGEEVHSFPGIHEQRVRESLELDYGAVLEDKTAWKICYALGEQINLQKEVFSRGAGHQIRPATAYLIKIVDGMAI